MNKEHFFVTSNSSSGTSLETAYNNNNISSSLSSSRVGFSRSSNSSNSSSNNGDSSSNSSNSSNSSDSSNSSEGPKKNNSFLGLDNLSQEQSFCLFNASKNYLGCLADCSTKEKDKIESCKYNCSSFALDDTHHCIYYKEPEEEVEQQVPEEEEVISSIERMNKLSGADFSPYAVYDTSYLEPKEIVNLKLENGIKFAQVAPDFKKAGGEKVNTEKPYLLWR